MDTRRLGSVTWPGETATASLFEDGSWQASVRGEDSPALVAALTELYGPEFTDPHDAGWILAEIAEPRDCEVVLDPPALPFFVGGP